MYLQFLCVNQRIVGPSSLVVLPLPFVSANMREKVLHIYSCLCIASGVISVMLDTDDPELSLQENIAFLKRTLEDRLHRGLWEPIQRHLVPLGCSANLPRGGYFVWLKLPACLDCNRLRDCIKVNRLRVDIGPGDRFTNPAGPKNAHSRFVRLCYAHYSTEELAIGVERLATAIKLALHEVCNNSNNKNTTSNIV